MIVLLLCFRCSVSGELLGLVERATQHVDIISFPKDAKGVPAHLKEVSGVLLGNVAPVAECLMFN